MKYDHDRELLMGIKEDVAYSVLEVEYPLLFSYLYNNKERKEELVKFIKKII